ncbi:LamG domain-containing protein [Gelidibacter mesophilus]|uniref:LamG domain-containing protein n=1 Tax=Gelidibacter mesophilus TaxID=169050 RepID=UPI00042845B3|nr:LamG domain-containing protein [Gelidibacter mesophilus]
MKNFNKSILGLFALMFMVSCYEGIDPISEVDPGPDAGAPMITIMRPANGLEIQVPEVITSTTIQFKVEDDIELGTISVMLDGVEIASYDQFVDYRIANEQFVYDNITTGDHILTISATDLVGNVSTTSSNFTKSPPYTPQFAGEQFYMPFDGDFTELVSVMAAEEVGSPGFGGSAYAGSNSYKAGTDSYISFPTNGLTLGDNFSGAFWYKVDATPDRAGILTLGANADDRNQGMRLFREGSAENQRIKLNVGTGSGDSWNDGGEINVAAGEWVHVAFTISATETKIYLNGMEVNTGTLSAPIDWTGVTQMDIGAGGPTFSYWNHKSDSSLMDELRLFDITLTQNEITSMIAQGSQKMHVNFNGSYTDNVRDIEGTIVGSPGFTTEAYAGSNAYKGAEDSYITFPTSGLLGDQFSASFWYNLNATPDRAGILVVGPPDTENPNFPNVQNNRKSGFRFFREGGPSNQVFKLNVGNGTADSWFDGGAAATIDPTANNGWIHLAFTISSTECVVYINGEIAKQGEFTGVDWTGCDLLSVMSGAPRFTEWGHKSDQSAMDELRIFDKALSQTEIKALMF